mmetsp:Transcript_18123/g.57568  ORF Transcript_18123/g.57568 Transcript_18123/m.57568 type:complete len:373 (+) Transcript_18123:1399-2517(+)
MRPPVARPGRRQAAAWPPAACRQMRTGRGRRAGSSPARTTSAGGSSGPRTRLPEARPGRQRAVVWPSVACRRLRTGTRQARSQRARRRAHGRQSRPGTLPGRRRNVRRRNACGRRRRRGSGRRCRSCGNSWRPSRASWRSSSAHRPLRAGGGVLFLHCPARQGPPWPRPSRPSWRSSNACRQLRAGRHVLPLHCPARQGAPWPRQAVCPAELLGGRLRAWPSRSGLAVVRGAVPVDSLWLTARCLEKVKRQSLCSYGHRPRDVVLDEPAARQLALLPWTLLHACSMNGGMPWQRPVPGAKACPHEEQDTSELAMELRQRSTGAQHSRSLPPAAARRLGLDGKGTACLMRPRLSPAFSAACWAVRSPGLLPLT